MDRLGAVGLREGTNDPWHLFREGARLRNDNSNAKGRVQTNPRPTSGVVGDLSNCVNPRGSDDDEHSLGRSVHVQKKRFANYNVPPHPGKRPTPLTSMQLLGNQPLMGRSDETVPVHSADMDVCMVLLQDLAPCA